MSRARKPWEFGDDDGNWPEHYDVRPPWEKLDPLEGVPMWEALYHFVDKDKAVRLFTLDQDGYGDERNIDPLWWRDERKEFETKACRHRLLLIDLKGRLWGKLLRGDVVAFGYSSQLPLDAPRRPIRDDRWKDFEFDVRQSSASGPGVEITQILIRSASHATVPEPGPKNIYSAGELRRWYLRRVEECARSGRRPSREEDHREANAAMKAHVSKRTVEELRRELAPDSWKRRGRPRRGRS